LILDVSDNSLEGQNETEHSPVAQSKRHTGVSSNSEYHMQGHIESSEELKSPPSLGKDAPVDVDSNSEQLSAERYESSH
jgi:hypothetical protein